MKNKNQIGGLYLNKFESKYFNTAQRFNQALLSLLEKKSFEYISVSEICREAGVNRSTFYLHYENTWDLLQETITYVLNNFCAYFPENSISIANSPLFELNFITEKYLYPYLSYIKENRLVFSTVLKHAGTFNFESIFKKLFDGIFDPILDRFNYPADEREYVIMFYLNGLTAIICQWLKDDCYKSIEEISGIIYDCIFGKGI